MNKFMTEFLKHKEKINENLNGVELNNKEMNINLTVSNQTGKYTAAGAVKVNKVVTKISDKKEKDRGLDFH